MPEDEREAALRELLLDEMKSGYCFAMGDLFIVLNDVMTPENVKLIKEIMFRMEHQESIRIATNFTPPDVRKD